MPKDIRDSNNEFYLYNASSSLGDSFNNIESPSIYPNIFPVQGNFQIQGNENTNNFPDFTSRQNIYRMDEEGTITNPPIVSSQTKARDENNNFYIVLNYLLYHSHYRLPDKNEDNAYLEAREQISPEDQLKQNILKVMLTAVGNKHIPDNPKLYEDFACVLNAYRKGVFNQNEANFANNLRNHKSRFKMPNASGEAVEAIYAGRSQYSVMQVKEKKKLRM